MRLDGLHHITMITGEAQRNVDFYADLLGLRLVKTTVNFDAPEAYHLYFGDETGSPGSILTWFEFAGAPRGRAQRHDHTPSSAWRPRRRSTSGRGSLSASGVACERAGTLARLAWAGSGRAACTPR
jgi:catechol 2,3-dioxygenase-like lactoylglutathione lyase family enzyme